jgi:hypothetical protein
VGLEGVAKQNKRETDAGSLEKIKPESQSGCSTSSSKDIVFNGCVLNFSPRSNYKEKKNMGRGKRVAKEKNVLNTNNISSSVEDSPIVYATFSSTY